MEEGGAGVCAFCMGLGCARSGARGRSAVRIGFGFPHLCQVCCRHPMAPALFAPRGPHCRQFPGRSFSILHLAVLE